MTCLRSMLLLATDGIDALRERLSKDKARFQDTLDAIKFICKDLWSAAWDKQVDNLRTNHRVGSYFSPITCKSTTHKFCLGRVRCARQRLQTLATTFITRRQRRCAEAKQTGETSFAHAYRDKTPSAYLSTTHNSSTSRSTQGSSAAH